MTELKSLLDDIEKLRNILIKMIEENKDLQDPMIIEASENMNQAIVKYSKLLLGKIN